MTDFLLDVSAAPGPLPELLDVGGDHAAEAIARLPEQFKAKANIAALISSIVAPMQDVEDALQQLLTERRITTAAGIQLDAIGRVVGQSRIGLSDTDYRRYLLARVSANRSQGTSENILRVARMIVNDATVDIELDNQGAAALVMRIPRSATDATLASILLDFLRSSTTGGVRLLLEYQAVVDADVFTLDGGTGLGLGDATNAATGGALASAVE